MLLHRLPTPPINRRWYFFELQALCDIVSIVPVVIDAAYMGTTGSLPRVERGRFLW